MPHQGTFTAELVRFAVQFGQRRLAADENSIRRRLTMSDANVESVSVSTFSPTPAPSPLPSMTPTPMPTLAPTSAPTMAPTEPPTPMPTLAPTTMAPTEPLTMAPTMAPTVSFVPTQMPTHEPTAAPTSLPTATTARHVPYLRRVAPYTNWPFCRFSVSPFPFLHVSCLGQLF